MGNIVKSKKVSQNSQRSVVETNDPRSFAPNPGIAFDQQIASAKALERVANYQPAQGKTKTNSHYKKLPTLPTAKPVAK